MLTPPHTLRLLSSQALKSQQSEITARESKLCDEIVALKAELRVANKRYAEAYKAIGQLKRALRAQQKEGRDRELSNSGGKETVQDIAKRLRSERQEKEKLRELQEVSHFLRAAGDGDFVYLSLVCLVSFSLCLYFPFQFFVSSWGAVVAHSRCLSVHFGS